MKTWILVVFLLLVTGCATQQGALPWNFATGSSKARVEHDVREVMHDVINHFDHCGFPSMERMQSEGRETLASMNVRVIKAVLNHKGLRHTQQNAQRVAGEAGELVLPYKEQMREAVDSCKATIAQREQKAKRLIAKHLQIHNPEAFATVSGEEYASLNYCGLLEDPYELVTYLEVIRRSLKDRTLNDQHFSNVLGLFDKAHQAKGNVLQHGYATVNCQTLQTASGARLQ